MKIQATGEYGALEVKASEVVRTHAFMHVHMYGYMIYDLTSYCESNFQISAV